ncbi:MAG: thiamine pyrophosphate-dependent dehydrogenase E1 component subunit alpha [Armatimonadota bacterium]
MELGDEQMLDLYRLMQLSRCFEDTVVKLYRQGRIVGGVFTGQGQEAITAGAVYALRPDDLISPIHRDLGAFLAKGMSPGVLLAQIMGKAAGPSRGHDTWTHTGDHDLGIIASTSMLGSSLPIACGAALACVRRGQDRVVVSFFGEGSTARGDFHEALNIAAIHKLPVIFVCENNQYAYSTPAELEMPTGTVAERACAYGFPGERIDGNDALIVHRRVYQAAERARAGEGPTLYECLTYRHGGHSAHDEADYRPPQEVEEWHDRDPIHRYHDCLVDTGILTREMADEIMEAVKREVDEAVEFASEAPYPAGEEAIRGLYAPAVGEGNE